MSNEALREGGFAARVLSMPSDEDSELWVRSYG